MPGYHIHEGLIDLPEGWSDRSLNVFSRELGPNQIASIVISRDDLDGALAAFIDKTMKQLVKQLPRFTLIRREPKVFGPIEGEEASFQWRRDGVDIYQRQAFLPVSERRVLTFTVSAPAKFRAEVDQELSTLLADFKLRKA